MGMAGEKDTSPELVSALRDLQIQLMILGGTKGALIRAPSPYRPTVTRAEAAPADKPASPKSGRKLQDVLGVLPEIYPPDGKTEDPTKTVQGKVIAKLGYDVSPSTVNRALGRADREK